MANAVIDTAVAGGLLVALVTFVLMRARPWPERIAAAVIVGLAWTILVLVGNLLPGDCLSCGPLADPHARIVPVSP